MMVIVSNLGKNEYDIHSLTKEFYPDQDITFEEVARAEGEPVRLTFRTDAGMSFSVETHDSDRDNLKRVIYDRLSEVTGKLQPWGTLTGIRPTKMAMQHINEGLSDDQVLELMKHRYYISDEKGRLSLDIAHREKEMLAGISYREGYSMYIDIPFCPTTCMYCSFTSNPIGKFSDIVPSYLEALIKEIKATSEIMSTRTLDTVYIGGGTPTTLEPDQLKILLDALADSVDIRNVKEFTVEAGRPDSITEEKLKVLKAAGVSRISVNPQTMKDETLRTIGRRHTVQQTRDAFRLARECGFDNINMDIILGLPGENDDDVKNTVDEISRLDPESLTVHSLAVKRASKLSEWIAGHDISMLHNSEATMKIAEKAALDMGMRPYYLYRQKNMSGNFENTGYAKEGRYGLYNVLIMEEVEPITALGAGGISKAVDVNGNCMRDDNPKDLKLYIEGIDEMIGRKRKLFRCV